MSLEVTVPSVGESVTEALLVQWLKNDGDTVKTDDPLFVIETDKITLEVTADTGGKLRIKVAEGETVSIGTVVAEIEVSREKQEETAEKTPEQPSEKSTAGVSGSFEKKAAPDQPQKTDLEAEKEPEEKAARKTEEKPPIDVTRNDNISPSAGRLAEENQVDLAHITASGPGGLITKGDVLLFLESSGKKSFETGIPESDKERDQGSSAEETAAPDRLTAAFSQDLSGPDEPVTRKPMTPIRRRIADHLLAARQNTAMLTTFNEIDMSRVMALRQAYKELFKEKHQISLGYMSFFTKACISALAQCPKVNAFIDGKDIVYHHYYHVGVAIGSGKGLVVPVIRHADRLGFAGIEKALADLVEKVQTNRLALADLEGGTFTISNGGIYGSLLSTPILNSPQSGILGMHKIEKRPVVVDDQVVIRPMMYVALSYDHRIVDGREAVTFLKQIKACIENPEQMLLEI